MELRSLPLEMIEYWCSRPMTGQCGAVSRGEMYQYDLGGMVEKVYICLTLTSYLSNKSASRGKGFKTTAVVISL